MSLLSELFRATSGEAPTGWTKIDQVEDETRDLSIFKNEDNDLLFAFGPTKGEVWPHTSADWWENFRLWPRATGFGAGHVAEGFRNQAELLAGVVLKSCEVYQPKIIRLVGFSQGAVIAKLILRYLAPRVNGHIVGFGFAEPAGMDRVAAEDFQRVLRQGAHSFRTLNCWGDPVPGSTRLLGYVPGNPIQWIGPYHFFPSLKFPNPIHNGDYYTKVLEGL